jgi:hypothetical protein
MKFLQLVLGLGGCLCNVYNANFFFIFWW